MSIKNFLIAVFVSIFIFSCSEDNDVTVPRNLQDYLSTISNDNFGEVIACAASASGNTNLTYIFYYPEKGAKDIRYYEANDLTVDKNDFSLYKRKNYAIDDVFGGKIQRFTRNSSTESWGLVTYILDGKLHKSNPIRLKNTSKPTGWTNQITIEYPTALTPKFIWSDFGFTDNAIYFQVISENEEDKFISGTYTYDKYFQFFDTSNVVLNINVPKTPEDLKHHQLLKYTLGEYNSWKFIDKKGRKYTIPVKSKITANNGDFLTAMAIEGHGIVNKPTFIVWKAILNGELVPLLTDYALPEINAYVVYPHTRYPSRKVRLFIDFLTERFGDDPYWDKNIK